MRLSRLHLEEFVLRLLSSGKLTKKSSHLLSDREILILEPYRTEGRKSRSLSVCVGRGNAESVSLPLCLGKKAQLLVWVLHSQTETCSIQRRKSVVYSYTPDWQAERKDCFICHMCCIWLSTPKPLFCTYLCFGEVLCVYL